MRRQLIQPYLFLLGAALIVSSCFNEPNYPNTPSVEFKGIDKYPLAAGKGVGQSKRDSIVITVAFKDGDGDLGSGYPIPKADSALYASHGGWGNYQIKTFRLINKQYVEYPLKINEFLVFLNLRKDKPKGPIEGPLEFSQIFQYGNRYQLYPTKFQIKIRDRALQESNVIETDTISVPYTY